MARDSGHWLLLIYLFLTIYLLPVFPGGPPEESAQWATAASIVEYGSFDIGWARTLIGAEAETVKNGEREYSALPPGTSVFAAPIYALTRIFTGSPTESNIHTTLIVMRLVLSTLPLLLVALWLYARETDDLSLAILLFATPLFFYSLHFVSAVLAALILYFAFRVSYDQRYVMPWHALVSGVLGGIALLCEFAAAVPIVVFGVGLFFADKRERLRRPLFFLLGLMPFLILLYFYLWMISGSPVAVQAMPIGWPSIYGIYAEMLLPGRGLFFIAPVLLLAVAAFFAGREAGTIRNRVKAAAVIITVLVMSGMPSHSDLSIVGPRQLVVIIPLMLDSFFDGETYEMSNLWQGFLFGISLVLCTVPVLVYPPAHDIGVDPYRRAFIAALVDGRSLSPTLANAFGAPPSLWTLAPVAGVLVLAAYLVTRNIRRPQRFAAGLIASAVACGLYLLVP